MRPGYGNGGGIDLDSVTIPIIVGAHLGLKTDARTSFRVLRQGYGGKKQLLISCVYFVRVRNWEHAYEYKITRHLRLAFLSACASTLLGSNSVVVF